MFLSKTGWTEVESSVITPSGKLNSAKAAWRCWWWYRCIEGKGRMAKKSSVSSRPAKRTNASAKSTAKKALNKRQIAVLTRIAQRQAAGDDSAVNYQDVPALSDEQLAKAFRPRDKQLISVRLDRDVLEWLKGYGEGYSSRLNAILRTVMEHPRRRA